MSKVAVVIPYYNASAHIAQVVTHLPKKCIDWVIVVDDQSPDQLPQESLIAQENDFELAFLTNSKNLGVGGATKEGFKKAIDLGAEIVIKVDADDQMDTTYIPDLIARIQTDQCDMAKGNRFRDFSALKKMPKVRRFGNLVLSFLTKAATGYWNNFDPTNGFFAIKTSALRKMDFSKIANRYFFETSFLAQLYYQDVRIKDVAMPAIYGDEKSNMQVWKMPFIFIPKLFRVFVKRMIKGYFIYDFNLGSLYLLVGFPLFFFGVFFGAYTWWDYSSQDVATPTGTIMIITLSIILGFQLLLQAIQYDIQNAPKAS